MLPKDANILFSVVNTKLRDFYPDFEAMCEDLDEDAQELMQRLNAAGFKYDAEKNRFV